MEHTDFVRGSHVIMVQNTGVMAHTLLCLSILHKLIRRAAPFEYIDAILWEFVRSGKGKALVKNALLVLLEDVEDLTAYPSFFKLFDRITGRGTLSKSFGFSADQQGSRVVLQRIGDLSMLLRTMSSIDRPKSRRGACLPIVLLDLVLDDPSERWQHYAKSKLLGTLRSKKTAKAATAALLLLAHGVSPLAILEHMNAPAFYVDFFRRHATHLLKPYHHRAAKNFSQLGLWRLAVMNGVLLATESVEYEDLDFSPFDADLRYDAVMPLDAELRGSGVDHVAATEVIYDKHTMEGKRLGRGIHHFFEEGQLLITNGEYDRRWEKEAQDVYMRLEKEGKGKAKTETLLTRLHDQLTGIWDFPAEWKGHTEVFDLLLEAGPSDLSIKRPVEPEDGDRHVSKKGRKVYSSLNADLEAPSGMDIVQLITSKGKVGTFFESLESKRHQGFGPWDRIVKGPYGPTQIRQLEVELYHERLQDLLDLPCVQSVVKEDGFGGSWKICDLVGSGDSIFYKEVMVQTGEGGEIIKRVWDKEKIAAETKDGPIDLARALRYRSDQITLSMKRTLALLLILRAAMQASDTCPPNIIFGEGNFYSIDMDNLNILKDLLTIRFMKTFPGAMVEAFLLDCFKETEVLYEIVKEWPEILQDGCSSLEEGIIERLEMMIGALANGVNLYQEYGH